MKRRERRQRNSEVKPGTVTWSWADGGTTIEQHGGGSYRSVRTMMDYHRKAHEPLTRRVLDSDMEQLKQNWSEAYVSYSGPTIGGHVQAHYPHPLIGNDFGDSGFYPDPPLWYSSKLFAETQPFRRSEYSMWVQAREMLELATLFQIKASSFLELGANSFLNVKFGWIPFLNDLKTVGELFEDHQKRVKELVRLAEEGWYSRKRVRLAGFSRSRDYNLTVATFPWPVYQRARISVRHKVTYHGSIRWGLAPGAWRFFEELEAENSVALLAIKKMIGLETPSPQDVWNVIPFSWLVDYFVKVNDFLGANFDDGLFEVSNASITRRQTWDCVASPISDELTRGSMGTLTYKKQRVSRSIVDRDFRPRIRFSGANLLSAGQWGVLAALLAKYKASGNGKPIIPS